MNITLREQPNGWPSSGQPPCQDGKSRTHGSTFVNVNGLLWNMTGWRFGTWILWLSIIILGMSSSQLTFTPSFFRGVGSTTNQLSWNRIAISVAGAMLQLNLSLPPDPKASREWDGRDGRTWSYIGVSFQKLIRPGYLGNIEVLFIIARSSFTNITWPIFVGAYISLTY